MKGRLILAAVILICAAFSTRECRGEIAGDDAFSNLQWEMVYEESIQKPNGVVQSICSTEHYIICIENTTDYADEPDTVSAYYKNDVDENGNPVQKYSLAKRVCETNWEHGNGMTYNPNTNEIYVSLYTNQKQENRGCLFVMDPDTLQYKRTIKISDEYNVLGIAYKSDTNQYVIQTNEEADFSLKLLDENFQVVEELGTFGEQVKGKNFQDMVLDGDYVINFPLTLDMNIGDFFHVFSLSRRTMVAAPQLDFGFQNILNDEPEGMCEIAPGVYVAAVNVTQADGARKIRFYKTALPYYFQVTVTGEDGTVLETGKVLRGEDYKAEYKPEEGYQLGGLTVDGQEIDVSLQREGYVLENIQQDHQIQMRFEPVLAEAAAPTEKEAMPELPGQEVMGAARRESRSEGIGITSLITIVIGVFAAGGFGCFYVHIRLERRRKYLRARARRLRRRRLAAEY